MGKKELELMVRRLRETGFLSDKNVEDALLAVDRYFFVPERYRAFTYEDQAIPIGFEQTISAPNVVAFMLEKLEIKKSMKVLEIGTGSGYNTALLSKLVGDKGKVITLELLPTLMDLAKENITSAGLDAKNILFITSDGSNGYEKLAPYDRIIVTAAMPSLGSDHPLIKQLKADGKLLAPVGSGFGQDLVIYNNKNKSCEKILPVLFVPLKGEFGFRD